MARLHAITRAAPLPIFVLAWALVCVWAFVFVAGVAEAQNGETGTAPETGIAPRVTVVQGGEAASEHVHEDAMSAEPTFGNPLEDIVVDFELVDRDGRTVTAEDFRGRHVLLGFGFTHCPDVCPLMVLNMGEAVRDTDAVGIFISVDTERDSPEITDRYASRFGERMIGLSGNISQINAAADSFKVSYVVTKSQNAYTVQHSANVFLIDPDGRLVDVFNFSTPGEELAAAMRQGG